MRPRRNSLHERRVRALSIESLFPTRVYAARLQARGERAFNVQLLRECRALGEDDAAGRRWSAAHYPNGFTSYATANRMHTLSPTFELLQRRLDRHVAAFVRALELDTSGRVLAMTDCWVNLMGRHAVHGLHLHPLSTLSGTYYVQTPPGSPGLKFEDPRLDRFMAAPPRRADAARSNRAWVTLPARVGHLVLFESWLRHEVAPMRGSRERVSVSFNYNWF
jgi:uncharacterized protein (TIGR02466 family)